MTTDNRFFKRTAFTYLLVMIVMAKLVIALLFLYWLLGYKSLAMVPSQPDQYLYLYDIEMINHNIGALFESDSTYHSNHTLYSRITGFLAWLLPFVDAPIVAAVLINTILHLGIVYYTTRLYLILGGKYPEIFFTLLSFSPTLYAYSFFALRDLMICCAVAFYMFHLFAGNNVKMFASFPVLFFLRPLILIYAIFVSTMVYGLKKIMFSRKIVWRGIVTIGILGAVAYFLLYISNMLYVLNVFEHTTYSISDFLKAMLGFGFLGVENNIRMTASSTNAMARFAMFDSIAVPIIYIVSMAYLLLRGCKADKSIAVVSVVCLALMAFSYISITNQYAFRKLLPVFPLLWIVCFLGFERWRQNLRIKKITSQRNRTQPVFQGRWDDIK